MNERRSYFFSIIVLIGCLTLGLNGYGQGKRIEKTYRWNYAVNQEVNFSFNNYDCDLIIHTWDKPEIRYSMTVDATLRSEEDARRLDAYIEALEFSHSAGSAAFNNRFWTSKKTVMGRKTMTLKGERTIRFSEFNMEGELWIPENTSLNLSSKYSEIEVEDLKGRVSLDLYNDKVYGEQVSSAIQIAAKYSTLEFSEMKDIQADLYSTTLEAGNVGSLSIVSKYSRFKAGDAGTVDIHAYNDKYSLGQTGDIRFIDKYSDLIAEQAKVTELDCYNSTVHIARVEDVDLKSKYGSFEFKQARNLNISSAYSDNYLIESLKTLHVTDTKYSVFKIDYLESALFLDEGYSDKLYVKESGKLKGMKLNGKYMVLEMAVDKELSFRFQANVQYPKFEIEEESMVVRKKIKDGSAMEMEAVKGLEKEGMPSFFVNGYDMAVTLTEQ